MALTTGSYITAVDFNTVKNKLISFRTTAGLSPTTPTTLSSIATVGVPIRAQNIKDLGDAINAVADLQSGCNGHYSTQCPGLNNTQNGTLHSGYKASVNSGLNSGYKSGDNAGYHTVNVGTPTTSSTYTDCSARTCNPLASPDASQPEKGYGSTLAYTWSGTVRPSGSTNVNGECTTMHHAVCSTQHGSQNSTWNYSYNSDYLSAVKKSYKNSNLSSQHSGYKSGNYSGDKTAHHETFCTYNGTYHLGQCSGYNYNNHSSYLNSALSNEHANNKSGYRSGVNLVYYSSAKVPNNTNYGT